MRWPWVSVVRLEERVDDIVWLRARVTEIGDRCDVQVASKAEEIAWLRARVAELEDRLDRRRRHEIGMLEAPRPTKAAPEPMPAKLAQYINRFASKSLRHSQLREAIRRNNGGEPWDAIIADVINENPTDIEAVLNGEG